MISLCPTTRETQIGSIIAVASVLLGTGPLMAVQQAQADKGVVISELLTEVQKGLGEAQTQLADSGFPPLESVTLTLQTEVADRGGGKVTVVIASLGRVWDKERADEITLTLRPPKPYAPTPASAGPSVSEQLVEAIVASARGVQRAKRGQPPLVLDRFQATFSFVVKTQTAGGLGFKIVPVTAELEGDLQRVARHTITVTFSR